MHHERIIHLIGAASELAGAGRGSAEGSIVLKNSTLLTSLEKNLVLKWDDLIFPERIIFEDQLPIAVADYCQKIAKHTRAYGQARDFFAVIGGDHSCAMGTWSGASTSLHNQGSLGLIWIDAHLDSHTFETSESGRIHGMPLAALLGHGDPLFTQLVFPEPKLLPENVCIIGARSFEEGELALLNKLKVRIFFMEEIKERGLVQVFAEALQIVKKNTTAYGISIDLDAFDPAYAPGVSTPAPDGLIPQEFYSCISQLAADSKLIGVEIAEFNPLNDKDNKTAVILVQLLAAICSGEIS